MASSPSPSPSPSLSALTASPAIGPTSLAVDVEALLQKLKDKEVQTLKDLVDNLDDKEREAAEKHVGLAKERRYRKKKVELEAKRRCWSLRNRGRFDVKLRDLKKKIDEELGNSILPQCYEEIKRLLHIEKNPIYAKALQEWTRKETLFTGRVERKKTKVANLKNEIYQLIGFFSVFQGVLLTAVSQSNLLHCNNLWSPIFLSVVASVVTIFGVVQKLMQIKDFQTTIHSEEQSLKEVAARLNTLRNKGVADFEFAKFFNLIATEQSTRRFWIYFWLVIGSLLIFSVGFPLSHWRISCDPGRNPYASSVSSPSSR